MENDRQIFRAGPAGLADGPTFMVRGRDGRLFLAVAVDASEQDVGEEDAVSARLSQLFRAGRASAALTAVEVNPAFEAAKRPKPKPAPKPKPQPKPQPAPPRDPAPPPGVQTETPGLQTETPGLQTG